MFLIYRCRLVNLFVPFRLGNIADLCWITGCRRFEIRNVFGLSLLACESVCAFSIGKHCGSLAGVTFPISFASEN